MSIAVFHITTQITSSEKVVSFNMRANVKQSTVREDGPGQSDHPNQICDH